MGWIGTVLIYLVGIPMLSIGWILGAYGAYLDYRNAEDKFEVFGIHGVYLAFGLVLVGSVITIGKLVAENHSLSKRPLRTEVLQHHTHLLGFIRQIGYISLLQTDGSELRRWLADTRGTQPITGGEAYLDKTGQVNVRILIENRPEWACAEEHLKKDGLWQLVADWKTSVARELTCRRDLYQAIEALVAETAQLPISQDQGGEFVHERVVHLVYERILRPIAKLSPTPPQQVTTKGSEASLLGAILIRCGDDHIRREVVYLYEHGHTLVRLEAKVLALQSAYPIADELTTKLQGYVADLGLQPTLPRRSQCHRCPD